MEEPHSLGHLQELDVELRPWVVSGHNCPPLLKVSEERLLQVGGHHGEVLPVAELAEIAVGEYPQQLCRVHGLHIAELCETVTAEFVRVEEGREATFKVEGLILKALEEVASDIGLDGMLCVVRRWWWG